MSAADEPGWHVAAALDDVWEGAPLGVEVAGTCIALYRFGDAVHAAGDLCPHQEGVKLSAGYLDGDVIECPMHQSCFNVKTGAVLGPPAKDAIPTYPIRIEDGKVYVQL
ncbi:MAG: non-heme iron oxygenase ferredoxin subunit [Comamonadaceae bacterium]|nr:MAG: non-heme iron oxygenase ferredoxin subunit [Comamonadaceae bacterium]